MNALDSPARLLQLLATWADHHYLRDLDYAFASMLAERAPEASPLALLAAALASHQVGRGHLLLNLGHTLAQPDAILAAPPGSNPTQSPPALGDVLDSVDLDSWRHALSAAPFIHSEGRRSPLLLQGDDLYLRRFWDHERNIEQAITARLQAPVALDPQRVRPLLDALFPQAQRAATGSDWQQIACALAARQGFAVITGGPGTGKTTTVIRLLALLQALTLQDTPDRPLRFALAAPTGKAAARLSAAIGGQVNDLDLAGLAHGDAVRAAIPTQVVTLHRLLGARGNGRFSFHAHRPLPFDAVVVDEASMIDEELMAALLDALPAKARLILLGDKDQLASVEAGAILASLCARAEGGHYTPATRDWLQQATGATFDDAFVDPAGRDLDQAVAMLRHSHRFGADSGIGRLARAVNSADVDAAEATLADPACGDVAAVEVDAGDDSRLLDLILHGCAGAPGLLAGLDLIHADRPEAGAMPETWAAWASRILAAQARFQLLCAVHAGPQGRVALNARIEAELLNRHRIEASAGRAPAWYEGRPVMVTANDADLDLRNGDLGITLRVADPTGNGSALRVAFPTSDPQRNLRWVLPSRLRHCETVYAMTVHKAQGSEFDHVALLLPEHASPVLTRELLYTAITRAKQHLSLLLPARERFAETVERSLQRSSRLFAAHPPG